MPNTRANPWSGAGNGTTPNSPAGPGVGNAGAGSTGTRARTAATSGADAQSAQAMVSGLSNLNVQTANVRSIDNVTGNISNNQLAAMYQALNSNPIARRNAQSLTTQLQRQGRIGATQEVIGYQNGTVIVASGSQAFAAPPNGFTAPAANAGTPGNTTGTTMNSAATTQTTSLVNTLATANMQTFNAQSIANANSVVNSGQLAGLAKAVAGNPQAKQNADRLTQMLRSQGKIGADQQVVGLQNGQVLVAPTDVGVGGSPAGASGMGGRVNQMTTGLAGLNLQSLPAFNIVDASRMFSPAESASLTQSLAGNPQATQAAETLTQQLRNAGRIGPTQRVVGFQNGQLVVVSGE